MNEIRIVSCGQTGADRAALDFAVEQGMSHGGWCPKGRLAEDGPIQGCYLAPGNVRGSDGTLVCTICATLNGGSLRTFEQAKKYKKTFCVCHGDGGPAESEKELCRFVNVAGPRASKEPEVADWVKHVLEGALLPVNW